MPADSQAEESSLALICNTEQPVKQSWYEKVHFSGSETSDSRWARKQLESYDVSKNVYYVGVLSGINGFIFEIGDLIAKKLHS